jgi:hypothetical protein
LVSHSLSWTDKKSEQERLGTRVWIPGVNAVKLFPSLSVVPNKLVLVPVRPLVGGIGRLLLTHKYAAGLKIKFVRDKHSSLFCSAVRDIEKVLKQFHQKIRMPARLLHSITTTTTVPASTRIGADQERKFYFVKFQKNNVSLGQKILMLCIICLK